MLIFLPIMLCCSAQNYAQCYAHVETVLLEYIHFYHKNLIFNIVTVLLEYI